jgi:16S rRNA (cytosine1402-N4)-methyltransferase
MSKDYDFNHVSVLYEESLELLAIKPDGCYVDCTLGGGGHSCGILQELSGEGSLIAFDKDSDAVRHASEKLSQIKTNAQWKIISADFSELSDELSKIGITRVNGILADLGVSSWQLDQADRGFSYAQDGPLDMRMNQNSRLTAEILINDSSEAELAGIIRKYGEERYAYLIAKAIVRVRQQKRISRTAELAEIIRDAMPGSALREKQHPARRTFQAVRIAVNGELNSLEKLLSAAPELLDQGGRLCIITFHSLEDRMVKEAFRKWEKPCTCPRSFPVCVCGKKPLGRQIERRGLTAGSDEADRNPRARSARIRCFERILEVK